MRKRAIKENPESAGKIDLLCICLIRPFLYLLRLAAQVFQSPVL